MDTSGRGRQNETGKDERVLRAFGHAWVEHANPVNPVFVETFRSRLSATARSRRAQTLSPRAIVASVTAMAACAAFAVFLMLRNDGIGSVAYQAGAFTATPPLADAGRLTPGTVLAAGSGGSGVVTLDDGRIGILLAANTGIEALAADKVRLTRGDAWLSVVPESGYFEVETPDCVVAVHGTSFGVSASKAGTEVILASGEISLTVRGTQEILEPGMRAWIPRRGAGLELTRLNGDPTPRWARELYGNAEAERASQFFPSAVPRNPPGE
ncbi:FecR domain-containing protein [Candidatus Poribacteria bacterium]|nr:FecR domain-containing protein [Candidatus Poribacteria bacterium]